MTNRKTLAQLRTAAARQNMYVAAWSPGGPTKYRFFSLPVAEDQDYFGPKSGVFTALGSKEAWSYLGVAPPKRR